MFGVVFPDRSFPLDPSSFTQIDPLHYLLDINHLAGDSYHQVKTLCIFLLPSRRLLLPSSKACRSTSTPRASPSFVSSGGGRFHPLPPPPPRSPSPWPDPPTRLAARRPRAPTRRGLCEDRVSVEDIACASAGSDAGAEARIERMAMKVGENLFNFMQSFCGVDGSRLVVPTDILDRWFKKFQERAKRDPSFLKEFAA
ncbi:LOW QUALITY PROTEIN: uncharacterized protein LOC109834823 [Asparagus officinalis]|uniref:LOW QUALITY PROTEIN: uncharacterized protein LOC109834823 n=1 Tax=Asparagus officinalis TaxID=4686 RepID=UPI00098DE609|nr:LOW QUALITY PROTEIN: uncharacterized protein LOC109834823 [Asparagus officinalis]